jgi:hypothetical protein
MVTHFGAKFSGAKWPWTISKPIRGNFARNAKIYKVKETTSHVHLGPLQAGRTAVTCTCEPHEVVPAALRGRLGWDMRHDDTAEQIMTEFGLQRRRRIARHQLRREPFCKECLERGIAEAAAVVDHTMSIMAIYLNHKNQIERSSAPRGLLAGRVTMQRKNSTNRGASEKNDAP